MSVIFTGLDQIRASILRAMLSVEALRLVFVKRMLRLSVFFWFSICFNFALSLVAPIWMIALGPILFGVAHLFASFRYVPQATVEPLAQKQMAKVMTYSVLLVGAIRLYQKYFFTIPEVPGLMDTWEIAGLAVVFIAFALVVKLSAQKLIAFTLVLLPLVICSWNFPIATPSVLLIAHNFVPFLYWLKLTHDRSEKRVAFTALALFTLGHLALLFGLADGFMGSAAHDFGPLVNPIFIAKQILPFSTDFVWLERAISMFAFGQAVHYFVWLKVIPEQTLRQQVPLTFTQAKKAFIYEMGPRIAIFAVVGVLGFVVLPMLVQVGLAREIYVIGASAHGYAEIAGLPFAFFGVRKIA